MANPAILSDLQARWPFPYALPASAEMTLNAAWRALQAEAGLSDLADRLAAGQIDPDLVVDVITAAALRVLQNPEGVVTESKTIDDRTKSITRDKDAVSTDLYFTAAELRRLRRTAHPSGAFTIRPQGRTPCMWE